MLRLVKSFYGVFTANQVIKMSGQSKISSFFSGGSKRSLSSREKSNSPAKRQKIVEEDEKKIPLKGKKSPLKEKLSPSKKTGGKGSPLKTSLSPEQKKKIEENKKAAEEKLKTKKKSQTANCVSPLTTTVASGDVKSLVGESWYKALEPEFTKSYFTTLCKFVEDERNKAVIYPPSHQVFSWTNFCPIDQVKVVILGQDPYHGPNQAHGLCFSVQKGVKPPPSLVNMFKELEADIDGFQTPKHGTLSGWAEQGVLLLNACLTVQAAKPNSHAGKGWEKFTDAVISWLNKNLTGVVFMLWGSYAQKKGAHIDKKKHHILKSVHPSPLSAHRGFLGCKHFSQCNKLLEDQGFTPIDWNKLPPS